VHGDFDGNITSRDATDAVLKAFALQSLLSSFCSWFVKRGVPSVNPVAAMDRPHDWMEPLLPVHSPALRDALISAAQQRQRPSDIAMGAALFFVNSSVAYPFAVFDAEVL
jgi:hypothetical protein